MEWFGFPETEWGDGDEKKEGGGKRQRTSDAGVIGKSEGMKIAKEVKEWNAEKSAEKCRKDLQKLSRFTTSRKARATAGLEGGSLADEG